MNSEQFLTRNPQHASRFSLLASHFTLPAILLAYFLITLAYSVINPLFEAPDEHWHFFTAVSIKENGRLPVVTEDYDEWTAQEAAQPPLYYILGALLIAPLDTTRAREQVWLNPAAAIGDASALNNLNRVIHTDQEAWPRQGYVLAAHILRAFSAVLGLGTLICLYGIIRLLWPDKLQNALLGTALVAFLPQFNFVHSTISNDPLITFLCSAALWQLFYLLRVRLTSKRLLLLGLTIGLAALSKNAGILLLIFTVGMFVSLQVCKFASSKGQVTRGKGQGISVQPSSLTIDYLQLTIDNFLSSLHLVILVILPTLLLVAPLWWRNWMLYGDITAASVFVRLAGGDRHYTLWQVLSETPGLWLSLFAVFGWFNVRAPQWVYMVWNAIVTIAAIGGIGYWLLAIRNGQWSMANRQWSMASLFSFLSSPFAWLLGWFLLVYGGLLMFMMQTEAAQGRLLFPAIVPLAVGIVAGLSSLDLRLTIDDLRFGSHISRFTLYVLPILVALLTTLYCLLFVIRPIYDRPSIVMGLPDDAQVLDVEMGQGLRLVGVEVETETAEPGDIVWLTLYWQTDTTPTEPPAFKLELFGRQLTEVARLHSYHGRGLYPANLWPPGQMVADRFAIRLDENIAVPVLGRIFVRLVGEGAGAEVGQVKIMPAMWPGAGEALATIGEGIEVVQYSVISDQYSVVSGQYSVENGRSPVTVHPGDTLQVNVTWRVTAVPPTDYTTLIHLAEPGQPPLAQGDSPPLQGDYPTYVWAIGEIIEDNYTLTIPSDLPAGMYPLWLGMYDSATIARLPLTVNGEQQAGDVLKIGFIEVIRP